MWLLSPDIVLETRSVVTLFALLSHDRPQQYREHVMLSTSANVKLAVSD
jgi:hypothetical protein